MPTTVTFSEKNKGWTSFFSWVPDAMCKLNNRFYSIKDGQLWLHNDKDNPIRNNFYGVQHSSKIKTVLNEAPGEDKIFKNLVLEGNRPWKATLKTNYTESTLKTTEFKEKESRQFAYLRKNEDAQDLHGHSGQGIGVISTNLGLTVTFLYVSETVSIGDNLYQVNGANNELIGEITDIQDGVITVNAVTTTPVNGYFAYAKKDSRIEGGEMRGYYLEVELENTDTQAVELFAINSNAVKSQV
jgi:hypothetical protein